MHARTVTFPEFTLESGRTLRNVPVAYHSWGRLSERDVVRLHRELLDALRSQHS